jgi:hypothetical protein
VAHVNGLEAGSADTLSESAALEQLLPISNTQLGIALRRLQDEARTIDPQSCVARFGSAF